MKSLTPYTDGLNKAPSTATLILSVKEPWFSLMILKDPYRKPFEVRTPSQWIKSRLFDKKGESRDYGFVKIINGYGKHRPYAIFEYEGFGTGYNNEYSFLLKNKKIDLKISPEQFVIFLGEMINYKPLSENKSYE